ncbi:c-type cytochrome [Lentisphaera profundi]|uniref:C-type cytochrome n=1 Tax=Lentisphaera profundi TaxID=1658616 RepID=A0ABY7W360_9BACT|nr:DUF6797 domain-containing protein [Lentisphaera profundi]WDE99431.1 c-type cytochrome [Lentisphaera profundi]
MIFRFSLLLLCTLAAFADQHVLKFQGKEGAKTIVLVAGDEEYRSEETMPMLGKILAKHHGFNCIVLFSWDNSGQYIDPNGQANVKGWHYLNDADLMIIGTRFRKPNAMDRQIIGKYLKAGKPVIGIRTSTHGFKGKDLICEGLNLDQFGPEIIGDGWVSHHGHHKRQGARGVIEKKNADHAILNNIKDVFAPSDVYGIRALTAKDTILLRGAVTKTLDPKSEKIAGPKNNPMQPLAWLHPYQVKGAKQGLTFTTTMGSSVDFVSEDLRRLLVNASYFLLGMDVPVKAQVDYIDPFYPSFYSANGKVWKERKLQITEFALGKATHYPDLPGSPKWPFRPVPKDKEIPEAPKKKVIKGAKALFNNPAIELGRSKNDKGVLISDQAPLVAENSVQNFELSFDYALPARSLAQVELVFNGTHKLSLPAVHEQAKWYAAKLEVNQEQSLASLFIDGKKVFEKSPLLTTGASTLPLKLPLAESAKINLGGEKPFSFITRFRTTKNGAIFSKCLPKGKWISGGKTLLVREGKLVYDIGWRGAVSGGKDFDDGKWHTALVVYDAGTLSLYADGVKLAEEENFKKDDKDNFVFKIGEAGDDFGGHFYGDISHVNFFQKAFSQQEALHLSTQSMADPKATFSWSPVQNKQKTPVRLTSIAIQTSRPGVHFSSLQIRPLLDIDMVKEIQAWSELSLERGEKIYNSLCITCHGNTDKEGSLPTALKFHEGPLKNGQDPLSMYNTLTKGFGQMMPQAWMTSQQKMDVIQYIREIQIAGNNDSQYFKVTPAYLASLPGFVDVPKKKIRVKPRPYLEMDYSSSLMWTLEVEQGNIVQKGIATRLDQGQGGIAKGKSWSLFDHDTLQLAAVWTGDEFIDWKGIAFDGSHGSHSSIQGDILFANPQGPAWANPKTGQWDDPRFRAVDNRFYGPLPRDWAHYKGTYKHGDKRIIHYTVGESQVWDYTSLESTEDNLVIARTLNFTDIKNDLSMRVAPTSISCKILADGKFKLEEFNGFYILKIPANQAKLKLKILLSKLSSDQLASYAKNSAKAEDLLVYTKGAPAQWNQSVETSIKVAADKSAYVSDEFEIPLMNPWKSWMRLSGLDFFADGKGAIVSTWQGDIWRLEGLTQKQGKIKWRRIAAGLYQPLGVKIVKEQVYIICRDQIVLLKDLNGDGEADYYQSFNNDHQVTEHFHEFAMGLETDKAGNFYYAKSARHAKPGLVPHHGTLLKVSKDGLKTEILATGFRAANGICVNDDGSFFVTDQEGHWTPKNRINWVEPGGFYGNFMGYHKAKSSADKDMKEPMIWLTNKFNRSPAELMWAKSDKWGPLEGQLLELSYGMGRIFLNLYEKVNGQRQGGQVKLPIEDFKSGVMRGRFNAIDGQLYALGMFAWAANKHEAGSFYRVRYTGKPTYVPTGLQTSKSGLELEFPIALANVKAEQFQLSSWRIKRTKNYGSRHENLKSLKVEAVRLSADKKKVFLSIPEIAPTRCMSIKATMQAADGHQFTFEINNTIHSLK